MEHKVFFSMLLSIVFFSYANLFAGKIHEAVKKGDLETIKQLLEKDPSLIYSTDPTHRGSLLYLAVKGGYLEIVKYLVENGAEINNNVCFYKPILWAIKNDYPEMVNILVKNGAETEFELLMEAMEKRNTKLLKYIVEKAGVDVDYVNNYYLTPSNFLSKETNYFEHACCLVQKRNKKL